MPQTSYLAKPAVAHVGMIADVGYDNIVMSGTTVTNIHVGSGCQLTANAGAPATFRVAELADGASAVGIFGIALYDSTRPPYTNDAAANATMAGMWVSGDTLPVLTRGRVWVYTEVATAVGDPVYTRVLAASTNVKGQFTNAATTNFILVANARYLSSTAGAGLVELELR